MIYWNKQACGGGLLSAPYRGGNQAQLLLLGGYVNLGVAQQQGGG